MLGRRRAVLVRQAGPAARFVRSFAGLDAVMRVYSDAAAFDRDLSDAVAKASAAAEQ